MCDFFDTHNPLYLACPVDHKAKLFISPIYYRLHHVRLTCKESAKHKSNSLMLMRMLNIKILSTNKYLWNGGGNLQHAIVC